jgi:uncharacterized protein
MTSYQLPVAPVFGLTATSGGFARQPFWRRAVLVALLTAPLAATSARSADNAACLELERQFEMVNRDASSLQVNEALFRACRKGCAPLARRLLDAGASVYARDRDGTMPLGYAAQSGQTVLVDLLLQQGAPVDARNLAGSTALYGAAENDRAAVVGRLLASGADPNLAGRSGVTPLAAAAFKGNKPIVDLLLANGSKPNEVDATGKSAIIYAAVQINARYGNDLTVLMWAAGYADGAGVLDAKNVVKLLLDRNADINAVDDRGRTALMIAAELDHAAIVDMLLEHGADRSITDKQQKTAVDLATSDAVRQALRAK